jgi:alkylation response protein AidB-like acyl-CoA dehydrogenase
LTERAPHASALAKAHLTEVYTNVSRRALELHGGIGFTWEHDAHVFAKRASFNLAWGGGPAIHFRRAADLKGW